MYRRPRCRLLWEMEPCESGNTQITDVATVGSLVGASGGQSAGAPAPVPAGEIPQVPGAPALSALLARPRRVQVRFHFGRGETNMKRRHLGARAGGGDASVTALNTATGIGRRRQQAQWDSSKARSPTAKCFQLAFMPPAAEKTHLGPRTTLKRLLDSTLCPRSLKAWC